MNRVLHILLLLTLTLAVAPGALAQTDAVQDSVAIADSSVTESPALSGLRGRKKRMADGQRLPHLSRKKQRNPGAIDDDITYSAKDSIVMEGTTTAILYGEAYVKYGSIELKADYIRLRLDSSKGGSKFDDYHYQKRV